MKITEQTQIWEQGNSAVVTVPSKFMKWNDLKPGDEIKVTFETVDKKEDKLNDDGSKTDSA